MSNNDERYNTQEMELMVKAIRCIEFIAEESAMSSPTRQGCSNWELIFRLAHAGRSPSCMSSHPGWKDEIEKLYEEFRK